MKRVTLEQSIQEFASGVNDDLPRMDALYDLAPNKEDGVSDVKPALTAEEWADHARVRGCGDALSDTADTWYPPHADGDPVEAMDQSLERAAAIALHRGSRPFTWKMVDAIRAAEPDTQLCNDPAACSALLASAAARIAALLPPRKELPHPDPDELRPFHDATGDPFIT